MKKFLFIILVLFSVFCFSQKSTELFNEGNTLYNEGDYNGAIAKYEQILSSGVHSAALYYNLGNANYKLNRVAPSIYFFEKALLLAPNDEDIQVNISFARNMTLDAIDILPESDFSKIVNNSVGSLEIDKWAVISIVFIFVFVLTFLLYYFSYRQRSKRLFFILSTLALIFCVFSVFFAIRQQNQSLSNKPAIVFAIESNVKSEPNNRSESVFVLHEGTKVNVLEALGNWKKIKLADGKVGWILKDDIKELKDF